jgi:hypothetical protein
MPQMVVWPFMARTMVEERRNVKPSSASAAAGGPQNLKGLKGVTRTLRPVRRIVAKPNTAWLPNRRG